MSLNSRSRTEPVADTPVARQFLHISGKNVPDSECALVGIDAGILYVRSECRVADTSAITVTFDRTQLSGYVTGCQPVEEEWVIAIELTSSGRRRQARMPMGEQFNIGIIGSNGTIPCQATVIDRSASGLGVRLERAVLPGMRVYVEMDAAIAFGEIRHCRATTDGSFIAGMAIAEFVPDLRSRGQFSEILAKVRWRLGAGIRGKSA